MATSNESVASVSRINSVLCPGLGTFVGKMDFAESVCSSPSLVFEPLPFGVTVYVPTLFLDNGAHSCFCSIQARQMACAYYNFIYRYCSCLLSCDTDCEVLYFLCPTCRGQIWKKTYEPGHYLLNWRFPELREQLGLARQNIPEVQQAVGATANDLPPPAYPFRSGVNETNVDLNVGDDDEKAVSPSEDADMLDDVSAPTPDGHLKSSKAGSCASAESLRE